MSWTPYHPPKPKVLVEAQPFIPYMKEENFDPRLKPVLDPYKKRMGFLPNALKLYAYRPEIAETLWALNSKVMRDPTSTLDQLLKRKLAAVACATNGCAYCTAHSCSMLKKPTQAGFEGWNMSEKELQDIITGDNEPANEMEQACFDYVRSASEDPTSVPDEILQRLKKHLTPPQIVELACVVGFWKFYNTVHDSLHIPVEFELLERYRVCQSLSFAAQARAGRRTGELDAGPPMPCRRRSSRAPLLEGGSDQRFRVLVADLFTISTRMEMVREHLGRRMGISGPQYSIVVAVAHLQGRAASASARWRRRCTCRAHSSRPKTGKLARRGLLLKRTNPLDRRGVLLSVAPAGRLAVDRVSAEIRAVNDLFFGALDAASFAAFSAAAGALVESSAKAVRYITLAKGTPQSLRDWVTLE